MRRGQHPDHHVQWLTVIFGEQEDAFDTRTVCLSERLVSPCREIGRVGRKLRARRSTPQPADGVEHPGPHRGAGLDWLGEPDARRGVGETELVQVRWRLTGQYRTNAGGWQPTTKVVAYEGQVPVRTMLALRGVARFPTPVGVFSIQRRVPNETMDSMTLGIPHDSPYGYLVKNVLYTQYFTPDGASLHDNYWSSNIGGAGSHGCLGLSLSDSKWLWDWARIGVPVIVNP